MENKNESSQTSSQSTIPQPSNPLPRRSPDRIGTKAGSFLTNKLFLITIVILIVFTTVYAGIYLSFNSKVNQITKPNPTPTIASQPSPTPDETVYTEATRSANWKTYTNIKYGFSIKYPQDWQVETTNNDSFIRLSNIKIDKQYKDAAKKIATEGFAFNNGLYIDVYETDKTLEDFIQSLYNNPDSPHGNTIKSTKNTELSNGMPAIFVDSNTAGYGLDSATLLKFKNHIFRFTKYRGGAFKLEQYSEDVFDKIPSTFQFTK